MNILFIHQNFPGQYLHLAQYIHSFGNNQIIGLGEVENIQRRGTIFGITTIGYPKPQEAGQHTHHYLQGTEAEIRRGQSIVRSLFTLRSKGFTPDVICVHPGWGEGLFIREMFPTTPVLMFAEFFFRAGEADLAFDPEYPTSTDWEFSIRVRNTTQLLSLPQANLCISPTEWQASRYPWYIRERIRILHDGVDTSYMHPADNVTLSLQPSATPGDSRITAVNDTLVPQQQNDEPEAIMAPLKGPIVLSKKDKVITYIARNLEPYRGFHKFMQALPAIQERHPDAHILIVGGTSTSYSPTLPNKETYKERMLHLLDGQLNLKNIHFLGRIPYFALRAMFRISSAHVYLTYPFVLSWSALEAMSCEALMIASRTAPVEEVMVHKKNALLVDFFDTADLVNAVDNALGSPKDFIPIRKQARETILAKYDLQTCLAEQYQIIKDLQAGKYPLRV